MFHNFYYSHLTDRKKDLVKLSTGKFVSFGKIESVLKVCPFVENICVYADPTRDYTVAMIVPSRPHVRIFDQLHLLRYQTHVLYIVSTRLKNLPENLTYL